MTFSQETTPTTLYLLGRLGEEQATAVEEGFFAGDAEFNELLIAENELTDAYVAGRLSDDDRVTFESRLMLSQKQRERTMFAKALIKVAASEPMPLVTASWFERFSCYWRGHRAIGLAFAFIAVLLILTGSWIMLRLRAGSNDQALKTNSQIEQPGPVAEQMPPTNGVTPPTTSSTRTAEPSKPRSSKEPTTATANSPRLFVATITVPVSSTRDASSGSKIIIPNGASAVRLQMDPDDTLHRSYLMLIETVDGRKVWRGRSERNSHTKMISVTFPAQLLKPEDYILTLKGRTNGNRYETIGEYALSIRQE